MNRELKFRQPIRNKEGQFIEWFYWGFIDGDWITWVHQLNGVDARKESQQYTGFKDRNGVDIYDGDILKYDQESPTSHHRIFFDKQAGRWYDDRLEDGDSATHYYDFDFVTEAVVIGNIHENPEMLQQFKYIAQ